MKYIQFILLCIVEVLEIFLAGIGSYNSTKLKRNVIVNS